MMNRPIKKTPECHGVLFNNHILVVSVAFEGNNNTLEC